LISDRVSPVGWATFLTGKGPNEQGPREVEDGVLGTTVLCETEEGEQGSGGSVRGTEVGMREEGGVKISQIGGVNV
jgi:hypothetical protein